MFFKMDLNTLKESLTKKGSKTLGGISLSLFLLFSNNVDANDLLKNNGKVNLQKNIINIIPSKVINKVPFLGKKTIYLTINGKNYGEYKWIENTGYVLMDHKDGEKKLELSKGNNYNIVLKDNSNIDLEDIINIENIKKLFSEQEQEKLSENLISSIFEYISKIEDSLEERYKDRFITFIDTNLNKLFLIYADENGKKNIVGNSKVSVGNPKRGKDYFHTPYLIIDRKKTGFYKNDWRALGTDGKGYGDKGNRIYYLGKYFVNSKEQKVSLEHINGYNEFHFALHTTTPRGLTQLGNPMSKGCIRTNIFINKLYDNFENINEGVFITGNIENDFIYIFEDENLSKLNLEQKQDIALN